MSVSTSRPFDRSPTDGPPLSGWERVSFEVSRVCVYGLSRVVGLGGLYQFGRVFGTLEWLCDYKRRRRVARQVAIVTGGGGAAGSGGGAGGGDAARGGDGAGGGDAARGGRRGLQRSVLRHFVRVRCDKLMFLIMDMLPRETLLERFEVKNRCVLDEALSRGRGMYMALSHLGSHHLVISLLIELGYTRIAGVRDAKMGAQWRFIQHKHEQKGRTRVEYFFSNSFPREIFRRFEKNYIIGSLIDAHTRRGDRVRTMEVEVFGERRAFLTGPFQIAMRCKAPIVQTFVLSKPNFRYEVQFGEPLVKADESCGGAAGDAALRRAVDVYAKGVEAFARRYPCHISRY